MDHGKFSMTPRHLRNPGAAAGRAALGPIRCHREVRESLHRALRVDPRQVLTTALLKQKLSNVGSSKDPKQWVKGMATWRI